MIIGARIPLGPGRHLGIDVEVDTADAPVRLDDEVVGRVVSARGDGDALLVEIDLDESKMPAGLWDARDVLPELSLDLHLDLTEGRPA